MCNSESNGACLLENGDINTNTLHGCENFSVQFPYKNGAFPVKNTCSFGANILAMQR